MLWAYTCIQFNSYFNKVENKIRSSRLKIKLRKINGSLLLMTFLPSIPILIYWNLSTIRILLMGPACNMQ